MSDGDPALAFGPANGPGGFSYSYGSRLYYSTLASEFPGTDTFAGDEAIAVSRTDDLRAAAAGSARAWQPPVIASRHVRAGVFSDKEAIWADNAQTSPHFGNVYLCWTSYRGDVDAPLVLARSTDGGDSWSAPVRITPGQGSAFTGPSFCTVRTESTGAVDVFWENGTARGRAQHLTARSTDGGRSFDAPRVVADVVVPGRLDPVHVAVGDPRYTLDGVAGARADAGLSVDIANGAPTGGDATDEIVMTWADGRAGLNNEQALVQRSRDRGLSWSRPVSASVAGRDRPFFPAVGISPDGRDVYVTYAAFLTPWQRDTGSPRRLQGVVRHADGDRLAVWQTMHRGATGDARGSSQNNLTSEFLGDYNYAAATRSDVAAVWNDVRDAADCPAIDAYRQSLTSTAPLPAPAPATRCLPRFGNSDIYGGV